MIFRTWNFTVFSVMNSVSAISLLVRSSRISFRTSFSRTEKSCRMLNFRMAVFVSIEYLSILNSGAPTGAFFAFCGIGMIKRIRYNNQAIG